MPPDRGLTAPAASGSASPWPPILAVASVMSTIYLAIVVLRLQTLPFVDLATAGLVAVFFSIACMLGLVLILRQPVYSYVMIFAIGAFLVSVSAFVLYPIEGNLAFGGFLVIYEKGLVRGLPVVMLAFSALTLGSSIAHIRKKPVTTASTPDIEAKVRATRETVLALYWFFLAVAVIFSLMGPGIFTTVTSGYTGGTGFADVRKAGEMSPAITISANWFLPWISVILLATSRNEKQFARSTVLAAIVCGIALLTGDRTTTVIMIAIVLQTRHLLGFPIHWRRLALLGLLGSFIIVTWPIFRTIPVKEWRPGVLAEALQEKLSADSTIGAQHTSTVAHVIGTMAPSYQAVMVSCEFVPEIEPYRLGFDLFRSVVTAVPFTSRVFQGFLRADEAPPLWMMNKIDPNFWTGRGFNQIAEVYLQGGAFSLTAIYLLLGWYLVWLWGRLRGEPDLRMLAFHSLVVAANYRWVRNDSGGVFRNILWAAILVYVLPNLYRWFRDRWLGTLAASPEVAAGADDQLPVAVSPDASN